jgi:hypothetical protein
MIKKIIIFIVIIVALVGGYFLIGGSEEPVGVVSLTESSNTNTNINTNNPSGEFLTLLLNVKNIKLDDSIFKEKAFLKLRDSSIVLVPEGNEGRVNPFAPIGQDAPAPSSSLNTNTLNSILDLNNTNTQQVNQELESLINPNN